MKAEYINGNVRAHCPDCNGVLTTFELGSGGREFGTIVVEQEHNFRGKRYRRILYPLLRCAGCHRGGLAKIHDNGRVIDGALESFLPPSIENAKIPDDVPKEIVAEFREAELCASFGALRAASALIRSVLEKTLKENGYNKGSLKDKIDSAANDEIITKARMKRVHEDIRVLGNDVLHDEWREVTGEEVDLAHHYTQRILEDFYDDRDTVEKILKGKGKIKAESESA